MTTVPPTLRSDPPASTSPERERPERGDHDSPTSHDHASHDHSHAGHEHSEHPHSAHTHSGHSHSGHSHSHGADGHHHAPASFGWVFMIGISLNTLYIGGEVLWGFWAHSLSLLADAGHNFSDVLGLIAAWIAQVLARRAPTPGYTYGLKRATILSALANATVLLLVTGAILLEALRHLVHPVSVGGQAVSLVALVGIAVNGFTALLFMRGAKEDLNIRGAFLHMASDAAMALAVVIAGIAITLTGWNAIDPIMSILVSLAVVWGTWSLLTQSLRLALDGVPVGIDPLDVERALRDLPGVTALHHLHIWPMSTTETALTVHLVVSENAAGATSTLLTAARTLLRDRFSIQHPTLQVESSAEDRETACIASSDPLAPAPASGCAPV